MNFLPVSPRLARSAAFCLATLVAATTTSRAGLVHRWSFNNAAGAAPTGTSVVDSVSGAQGFVRGGGATFSGTALTLPGTTNGNQTPAAISAYVDLPNGIISSKTNLTVEVWATQVAARNWQRLFDFGRTNLSGNVPAQGAGAAPGEILPTATAAPGSTSSSDNLMLAINRGTTANQQRVVGRLDGAPELGADTNLTLTPGTQYHFALTFTAGAGIYGANGRAGRVVSQRHAGHDARRELPPQLDRGREQLARPLAVRQRLERERRLRRISHPRLTR